MAKSLPAMRETEVQSLGWEDHLEKEVATHSSILAWEIPWTEEPAWATVYGVTKIQLSNYHFHFSKQQLIFLRIYYRKN